MKFKDKGYWVSHHFYWQSLVYYFLYSARFRSFTFFAACDPAIDMGGMLDENKSDIYDLLPPQFVPTTIKQKSPDTLSQAKLDLQNLVFPLVVKPNIGFKGYKVIKVNNLSELNTFIGNQEEGREWLIQEFLDYKREFSLLFFRIPGTNEVGISSLVEKIYPSVTGDGKTTLANLIANYENPFLDRNLVKKRWKDKMQEIPIKHKKIILDEIGNYARGSKFYSIENEIDTELLTVTKKYFANVEGLDFFRMDFKSNSLKDYKKGNFKILEINGMKSEPIHIYDPKNSFTQNTKTIHRHWMTIRDIVKARKKNENFTFPTTAYGLRSLFAIKRLTK